MQASTDSGRLSASPSRTERIAFETARPEDDAAIRRLLREQPMGGWVRVSLEREPDARLAAGIEGDRRYTFVARECATGRVLGMGSRAVRRVWLGGEQVWLGYLGQLRREEGSPSRLRLLARGFAAMERTRLPDELPCDLTSIVADNLRARRLLERGLPGMPAYRPISAFTTLTFEVKRSRRRARENIVRGTGDRIEGIAACLRRNLRRYAFAPVWDAESLRSPTLTRGLAPDDFFTLEEKGRVRACLALWDQRGFKQAVVRGYDRRLARARPLLNLARSLTGRPRLPAPGHRFRMAYLSHVAVDGDRADDLLALIDAAMAHARERGLEHLVIGMISRHPMLAAVRRAFRCHAYESVLYLVHRPGDRSCARWLDNRLPHVEVATL